jgi:hypothetical protein
VRSTPNPKQAGGRTVVAVWLVCSALLLAAGCSSDTGDSTAPTSTAPTSTADVPTTSVPEPSPPVIGGVELSPDAAARAERSMRGQRYCEVLLVDVVDGSGVAEVFNTWPLNECPEEAFRSLDAAAIAAANGVSLAVLNGPRYWLMDSIEKSDRSQMSVERFGDLDMIRQASVDIGPVASAGAPYQPRPVDRRATFVFDAGSRIYELTSPDGQRFVMQTWSQQVDPALSEDDLVDLGARLQLPAGWTYSSRVLDSELVLDTSATDGQVLQDDLRNSYTLVTD